MLETNVYGQGERHYNVVGDHYREVKSPNAWKECPDCHCKPLIWIFDNGCYARCCCGDSVDRYDATYAIRCESLTSIWARTGSTGGLLSEERLMDEWNYYCDTGDRDRFKRFQKEQAELGVDVW